MFSYHLRLDPDVFDFEAGVPVGAPVRAQGRVRAGWLPAASVARATYHGPYEGLGAAWAQFGAWLAEQGHVPGPDLWECCVAGPETHADAALWRTELNRPLAGVGA